MTGQDALRRAVDRLRLAGIEDAVRDARILVAYAMGVASDRLTLHLRNCLTAGTRERRGQSGRQSQFGP